MTRDVKLFYTSPLVFYSIFRVGFKKKYSVWGLVTKKYLSCFLLPLSNPIINRIVRCFLIVLIFADDKNIGYVNKEYNIFVNLIVFTPENTISE